MIAKVGGFGKHDISFKAKYQAYKYFSGQSDTYIYDETADEKKSRDAEHTPSSTPTKVDDVTLSEGD